VITSWRSSVIADDVQLALRLYTGDPSGTQFTPVAESAFGTLAAGATPQFLTRIPVTGGELLGLHVAPGSSASGCLYASSDGADIWGLGPTPAMPVGQTETHTRLAFERLNASAVLEPDADGDGFGDETQDQCSTDPTAQGACQGPLQTLTAKKKQDVDKAAVFERLTEAGTVTLKGKVQVPASSRGARLRASVVARAVKAKKATRSLVANRRTKIRIKFSRSAKRKIKAAIEDAGPRKITVTAKARDAAGNSTTKKVRFKLTD
jgi:hypothetical protein